MAYDPFEVVLKKKNTETTQYDPFSSVINKTNNPSVTGGLALEQSKKPKNIFESAFNENSRTGILNSAPGLFSSDTKLPTYTPYKWKDGTEEVDENGNPIQGTFEEGTDKGSVIGNLTSKEGITNQLKYGANVVGGLGNMASGIGNMLIHPADTAQSIVNIGAGYLEKGANLLGADINENPEQKAADAMNEYASKYALWTPEGRAKFTEALQTDPTAIIGDLLSVVSGGAGIANKINTFGKTAEAANAIRETSMATKIGKAADKFNPYTIAAKPITVPAKAIYNTIKPLTKEEILANSDKSAKAILNRDPKNPGEKWDFDNGKLALEDVATNAKKGEKLTPEVILENSKKLQEGLNPKLEEISKTNTAKGVTVQGETFADSARVLKKQLEGLGQHSPESAADLNRINKYVEKLDRGEKLTFTEANDVLQMHTKDNGLFSDAGVPKAGFSKENLQGIRSEMAKELRSLDTTGEWTQTNKKWGAHASLQNSELGNIVAEGRKASNIAETSTAAQKAGAFVGKHAAFNPISIIKSFMPKVGYNAEWLGKNTPRLMEELKKSGKFTAQEMLDVKAKLIKAAKSEEAAQALRKEEMTNATLSQIESNKARIKEMTDKANAAKAAGIKATNETKLLHGPSGKGVSGKTANVTPVNVGPKGANPPDITSKTKIGTTNTKPKPDYIKQASESKAKTASEFKLPEKVEAPTPKPKGKPVTNLKEIKRQRYSDYIKHEKEKLLNNKK